LLPVEKKDGAVYQYLLFAPSGRFGSVEHGHQLTFVEIESLDENFAGHYFACSELHGEIILPLTSE
ncbi:MAG TPA: hypothetical protein VGS22_14790, partial [Thermoanaerobaculia bacterium]|nr:hypothetical protein [Thermoanaerobaculia bacterium]